MTPPARFSGQSPENHSPFGDGYNCITLCAGSTTISTMIFCKAQYDCYFLCRNSRAKNVLRGGVKGEPRFPLKGGVIGEP